MEKIKILRIIARLNIGGPAIHTVLLTADLDKTRFQTLLVCGSPSGSEGDMGYYANSKSVKPYFIPELGREINIYNDFISLLKILALIKKEKPQIIHTHTAKAGTIARAAGIIFNLFHPKHKVKLIHTFHGHVFKNYFGGFKTGFFILIERILAYFSDKIITVSAAVRDDLINLNIANKDKIEILPLGFDLDAFLAVAPKPARGCANIGIIGRLTAIKNHRLFLEGVAKLIKQNVKGLTLNFKVIGDGELKNELEGYAQKLNIHEKIDFMGWQQDIAQVYSELDLIILTSLNEGTPVSLIEAMASGRAVIATDVGGVRDLLGKKNSEGLNFPDFEIMERGILIKSGDSSGLANAAAFLLSNPQLCATIAGRGRIFARANFTKERLVKDMENLYSRVLICTF
ncbi:MAG: glycosyltransferase [Candidatus Omnitrophica bacterium]|nr:glycosyltransferase [Candidatus Omnitrophota bacterium]